ncbi:DNA recombination protein RmuC homolog [Burkholderiales bacterium 8X]|nr:DNA recombination protein RmuC homolog [Burkholderiales bacterium 8X]
MPLNEILLPTVLFIGLVAGATIAWLVLRSKARALAQAATLQADAVYQVELAQLRERIRASEDARRETADELGAARRGADGFRAELEAARQLIATLTERASRVPELERELQQVEATSGELSDLRERAAGEIASLRRQTESDQEGLQQLRRELQAERAARAAAEAGMQDLGGQLREARTLLDTERQHAAQRMADLLAAKESLTAQFKSLASDILEEKSKRFAEQNQATLGQLLEPLKGQLTEFKAKVEEVYVNEGKDRSALASQVKELVGLNQALSQDAKNLTSALKGSSKTQGNWGELILERVLEASGLRKNHEYVVQDSQRNEDGSRQLPDVVIHLPGDRRLVVDAKVSLVAYEQYVSAEADEARTVALRRHLDSVRGHIKVLSEKKYQQLYQLQTLDFVLMFVPVEPAFMSAVTHDDSLFMNAWERNVLLVSPSTLLFVVRTVAHLWRQEAQSRNAQDIAKRGAELYDKLVDFVKDLDNVGDKLGAAQKAYTDAHKRLATGRGNIIRQAEMLRGLGVKPSKQLGQALVDEAREESVVSDRETLEAVAATHPNGLGGALRVSHAGPQ